MPVLDLDQECICLRKTCLCINGFSRVIFLDWDDTLLASSALSKRNLRPYDHSVFPQDVTESLEKLEDAVIEFMTLLSSQASVYIITNSTNGWVELSCHRFFPRLYPLLENIPIVSARSLFEHIHPNDPFEWKKNCFQSIFSELAAAHPSFTFELVSVGDSEGERVGSRYIQSLFPNVIVKCIKLIEYPSMMYLAQQISLLKSNFFKVLRHGSTLDLNIQVQPVQGKG
ncbi:hypothetical protein GEMRC1_003846 [Eukaryota sp. GEM-RC1]